MKFWLCGLILLGCAVAAAQPGSEASAVLFGRVVNAQTREPVRRAAIKIYNSKDQWDEFTYSDGRFKFPPIKRGQYGLATHRDGYSDRFYIVELSDFDDPKELPVELFPQGVVTGKVVDGFGQPLQEATVEALRSQSRDGKVKQFTPAETNDLGEYRLSGLDPGRYRIRATYRDGRRSEFDSTPLTMASAFYGGAAKPAELVVKAGSVTGGIDFVLNPVRGSTIRGTLHTITGAAVDKATLWIMGKAGEGGHNGNAQNGAFEVGDVSPGTYTISAGTLADPADMLPDLDALRGIPGVRIREDRREKTAPLFGIATVEVRGEDVSGVDVVMQPVPKIEGQVLVEGGDVSSLKLGMVSFHRTDGIVGLGMGLKQPRSDGTFEVFLPPGEYLFVLDTSVSKLSVKRVTFGDKPIANWKLTIDSSPEPKKLVFVLSRESQK